MRRNLKNSAATVRVGQYSYSRENISDETDNLQKSKNDKLNKKMFWETPTMPASIYSVVPNLFGTLTH
jgi:hypothetical protein